MISAPDRERQVHHHGHGEDVEERQHRQRALLTGAEAREPGHALAHVRHQIGVAQHRPLGQAGGAAGVLQHRDVARGVDLDGRHDAVVVDEIREADAPVSSGNVGGVAALEGAIEQVLREWQDLRHRAHHQRLQRVAIVQPRQHVVGELQIEGDDDAAAGIADEVAELLLGIERVDVDDRAARGENAVVGDDVVGRVRQHESDAHARSHAELGEALGGAPREVADLAVGVDLAEEIEAGPRRIALDAFLQRARDRLVGKGGIPPDARRIGFEPRPSAGLHRPRCPAGSRSGRP